MLFKCLAGLQSSCMMQLVNEVHVSKLSVHACLQLSGLGTQLHQH